jgi:hypothetical protein
MLGEAENDHGIIMTGFLNLSRRNYCCFFGSVKNCPAHIFDVHVPMVARGEKMSSFLFLDRIRFFL